MAIYTSPTGSISKRKRSANDDLQRLISASPRHSFTSLGGEIVRPIYPSSHTSSSPRTAYTPDSTIASTAFFGQPNARTGVSGAVQFVSPSDGQNFSYITEPFLSPEALSTFDEYAENPRFLELQEELRSLLFTGATSNGPTRAASPEHGDYENSAIEGVTQEQPAVPNLMKSVITNMKRVEYLNIWTTECAPWLDMFDQSRHFGIQVPIMAKTEPALLYGLLALSARQMERKKGLKGVHESLELYQESIKLLTPLLEARDVQILVTCCILCCLEMMSVSPRDWRRHVEGCAALFESYGIHGFSGGLLQAVFWCYARMDLCGAIISDGAESTVLHINRWVSQPSETPDVDEIKETFLEKGRAVPDMHANYAVYLCAKSCDLVSSYTRFRELGEANGMFGDVFHKQWSQLWNELQEWNNRRPPEMLPIKSIGANGKDQLFPEIFFVHWAAISSNQLYHTACIMMLDIKPTEVILDPTESSNSAVWHARRVVGISMTNPHRGCLNNAIQPLFVAGKLLSHRSEHLAIIRLIKKIEETTGWGACWRIKDLEDAWGYDRHTLV